MYIQDSLKLIKDALKEGPVVIRVETSSGFNEPIRLTVAEVKDDYIIANTKNQTEAEFYSFAHITNWRFVK